MIGDDLCKGCLSSTNSGLRCVTRPIVLGKRCPCLDCLVKGVCFADASDCDDCAIWSLYCEEVLRKEKEQTLKEQEFEIPKRKNR